MKQGFTLIELLVVVLIIGILSAVALPQYVKAVEKARFTEAESVLAQGRKMFDLYFLEGGELATGSGGVYFTGNNPQPSFLQLPASLMPYNKYVSHSKYYQYWISCNNHCCVMTANRLADPEGTKGNEGVNGLYSVKEAYCPYESPQRRYNFEVYKQGSEADAIWSYLKSQGYHKL